MRRRGLDSSLRSPLCTVFMCKESNIIREEFVMRKLAWFDSRAHGSGVRLLGAAARPDRQCHRVVTDATGRRAPARRHHQDGTGCGQLRRDRLAGRYTIAKRGARFVRSHGQLAGLRAEARKQVVVPAGRPATVEVRLQIGGQAEAIQVTGTLIPRRLWRR